MNRATEVLSQRYPHLASRVRFMTATADQPMPFADREFDVVVACAVVEHVVDLFTTMDEIARVCKPGGCTVITVPNLAYIKHTVGLLFGQIPLTGSPTRDIAYWREHGWDGGHFHYFTKRALYDLLVHVGFQPEAWTGDGKWAKVRRWGTNLVGNLTVRARRR
jgi:SAM-dependent methyltransferase